MRQVHDIEWGTLQGAYGPSDRANHYRDLPGMFLTFAKGDDVDSGSWGDAYDDALLAHVWHQYTIYPVTVKAIGPLIRLAEGSKRELGEACGRSFVEYGNHIRTWIGTSLEEDALAIGAWIPDLGVGSSAGSVT